jgi:hypothetical protein
LRSGTEAGVSYRDYAPRVLDAKVRVDKYIGSATNDPAELRRAISLAIREYVLASESWNVSIANKEELTVEFGQQLVNDPEVSNCPLIRDKIETWTSVVKNVHDRLKYIGQKDENLTALWGCAAAQIGEVERLLVKH